MPQDNSEVIAVHAALLKQGMLREVTLGGPEERLWLDCDLASLAENRLGDRTDPRTLTDERRTAWRSTATEEAEWPIASRSRFEQCYWLQAGGERVGTMALSTSSLGSAALRMASFYVFPTHRRLGIGRRALHQLQEVLAQNQLGLRLETNWCWPRTVQFYVAAGMWVYMWKRELTLCSYPHTPLPQIQVGDTTATLHVTVGGEVILLAKAHRHGDRVEFEDLSPELAEDKRIGEAYWHAFSTLSLALAQSGWPLVRSPATWEKSRYADANTSEGLAYKIIIWEAKAKSCGWLVETPRIAGLVYPTWDELIAQWKAENEAYEARQKKDPENEEKP